MVRKIVVILCVISCVCAWPGHAKAAEQQTAAVLDLEPGEGVPRTIGMMLSDYLRALLFYTHKFNVKTRQEMEKVFNEQQFPITGCAGDECAARAGRLLGAQKVFAGIVEKSGDEYIIAVKMIDVESGRSEWVETADCAECREDSLLAMVENFSARIEPPPLPEPKQEPEAAGSGAVTEQQAEQPAEQTAPAALIGSGLKGRFGLGVNYLGLQARYAVSDAFMVEGKVQFGSLNTLVGGRGYFIFTKIPGTVPIFPYAGAEFSCLLSQFLKGGVETGGFAGVELMVAEHIGLGADAGLYYINVWSSLGGIEDIGLIFNAGVTYYF